MEVKRRLGIQDVQVDGEGSPTTFQRGGVLYRVREVFRRNEAGTKFLCRVWSVRNKNVEIRKEGDRWFIQPSKAWTEE